MRTVRLVVALAALSLVTIACGDDGGATTSGPGTTGGVATTTGGPGGGGANGSIVYEITGDYEASGELPFVPAASTFSGGWLATFAQPSGEPIISMNTMPGSLIANYADAQAVIPATEEGGCTFDIVQNDSSGLVGSFACSGLVGFSVSSGAERTVNFSAEFSAHP